jgi:phosphatidylserine/phosphatidylglycerophosphate/cardiolipin synthase-like enzyme
MLGQYYNVYWIARFPYEQPTTATCFCDCIEMYWIAYVTYSAFTGDESHIRPGMLSQTESPKELALSSLAKLWEKASTGHSAWDTVSSCYMLGGEDIRKVPWPAGGSVPEIDAFVSEELYVHSKVLIADDRVVICGSANLNDRSLKGSRDSEIALVIEDKTPLETRMDGQPFQASKFAAMLRRYLYRKHLGLLAPQDMRKPDSHFSRHLFQPSTTTARRRIPSSPTR